MFSAGVVGLAGPGCHRRGAAGEVIGISGLAAARVGGSNLLERSVELNAVRELLEGALSGVGQALVLEGPAGIGKTAILDEAKRLAHQRGVRAASATGSELERDYAFGALRRLLGGPVTATPASGRAELFEGAAAPAAGVLGIAVTTTRSSSLPEDPAAVMHALYWLVANLAESQPLMLIADDIQWFDPPSQRFLAYLARRVGDLAVGMLMATRPIDADAGVVAGLLADQQVPVLLPAPLSPGAVGQVIASRWEGVADDKFVTACHHAGGGNPFLTGQLLQALQEADMQPTAAAAATVLSVGSDGARRQVLSRLARLPAASNEVVRAVAVLGPDATIRQVAALVDEQREEDVAVAVEVLAAAGLVVADRPVRFVHPLVCSAVYEDMGPAVRAWWHARAARNLAYSGVPNDRVASHLMLVEPDGNPWAVEVLVDAADIANQRGAPDAAAALYRRALAEPPPPVMRYSLLLRLGGAERAAGETGAVEHLAEALAAAGSDADRVGAAWQLRTTLVGLGRGDEAVAMLEQVRDVIEDEPKRLIIEAAIVQTGLTSPLAAPSTRTRLHAFASMAASTDPQTIPPTVAVMAAAAGWFLNIPARTISRLVGSTFERATPSDIPMWGPALGITAVGAEHPDASQILDWVISAATQEGDLPRTGLASAYRALYRHQRGALVAAAGDADTAMELCLLTGQRQFLPLAVATRTYCHLELDEPIEARKLIESHHYGGSALDDVTMFNSHLAHARGLLNLVEGRIPDAIADLRDAGRRLHVCSFIAPSFLAWRSDLAMALVAGGYDVEAMAVAAEELELARAFGTPRCVGVALHAVGVVDRDHRSGEQAIREAVTVLSGSRAPVELARALLDLGSMLRRRGARAEAREPLTRSLDMASSCGAIAVAARARDELATIGARPRRARLVGIDSLTVTEARTAGLAARGATNKQIAQTMFVTIKTVETHLAHAYQKLGVSRRAELVGALHTAPDGVSEARSPVKVSITTFAP